jgi:(2Fe-2S) ferredoxin
MRSDRREATQYDELDDDEYERLTQEHLRGGRAESA